MHTRVRIHAVNPGSVSGGWHCSRCGARDWRPRLSASFGYSALRCPRRPGVAARSQQALRVVEAAGKSPMRASGAQRSARLQLAPISSEVGGTTTCYSCSWFGTSWNALSNGVGQIIRVSRGLRLAPNPRLLHVEPDPCPEPPNRDGHIGGSRSLLLPLVKR